MKPARLMVNIKHVTRKSDRSIVVRKFANKMPVSNHTKHSGANGAKGSSNLEYRIEPDRTATQSAESRLTGPMRLHQAAKRDRSLRFDNLLHHITPQQLLQAYQHLNKKSAKGVDGESWLSYGRQLSKRLNSLHTRIHTMKYQPQPVKRIWIPKANGDLRPIGITTVEDKIVQQVMVWILESIYETDFLGFSYGFRPNRNQHKALDAVYVAITQKKVSWVLDADISKFFDTINHKWLMRFMAHRIADKRLLAYIERTIKAGVIEQDQYSKTEVGTPQGAVISPLLANIYLHYVLDLWAHQWRKRHAKGECYIVRYADDSVFGFQYENDGVRFEQALSDRLNKFGLALNQDKTRLIEFGRFAVRNYKMKNKGKPSTFDFLGFTHICSTRWSSGRFKLLRKTVAKKMKIKLLEIKQGLRKRINIDVYAQGKWLNRILVGHCNYYAVPDNGVALDRFKTAISRLWLKLLKRRSQKFKVNWKKLTKLIRYFLPNPKILHPYPNQRFRV
jgi:RNA-directed DNA polymerase